MLKIAMMLYSSLLPTPTTTDKCLGFLFHIRKILGMILNPGIGYSDPSFPFAPPAQMLLSTLK
jgi:hypothetical protein